MKNILCYGDSNTWGYIPGSFNFDSGLCSRYPLHIRWTGLLNKYLGEEYIVLENALNGRTINSDVPGWLNRNGLSSIDVTLETHSPLDLIIIMLGTNDLKSNFSLTTKNIADNIKLLIEKIKSFKCVDLQNKSKILLISPPVITKEDTFGDDFKGAIEKSKGLASEYKQLVTSYSDCYFLDAGNVNLSEDGIHLNEQGHFKLGSIIAEYIKNEIYSKILTLSARL